MMSGFLEAIASWVDPPLTVLKFEGDAAFAVGSDDVLRDGDQLLSTVTGCYADFVRRNAEAGKIWTCRCAACSQRLDLDLKFVIHHGTFFIQPVGEQVEAVGPEVNVAHRLLKNQAADLLGSNAYCLFTEEAMSALQVPTDGALELSEIVDDGREVRARVFDLRG